MLYFTVPVLLLGSTDPVVFQSVCYNIQTGQQNIVTVRHMFCLVYLHSHSTSAKLLYTYSFNNKN